MNKKKITKETYSNFFSGILILLYLCIGFIPNFGAVDKIAPQWLSLSVINLFASLYILIYYREYKTSINFIWKNVSALFYILFFIWASFSYFYALNPIESLVNIPRHANTLFMFLFIFICLQRLGNVNKYVIWLITIILGIEVYSILDQAYEMFLVNDSLDPGKLKGVTANRNIAAFSLAVKLPFLLLLLDYIKKNSYRLLVFLLSFFCIFSISIIASRASFIAILLVAFGYIGLQCYNHFFMQKKVLYKTLFIVVPILLSVTLNQIIFPKSSDSNIISRAATIKVDGTDNSINQRLRYYTDVISQIKKHPFLGVGIGNWKLKSIDYDKKDINGYVVPYHAHSDFIQLGAELGIIGFVLYLGIFISALILGLKSIYSTAVSYKEKNFILMMIIALGVYLIDANLNFPIARPQVLCTQALILALITIKRIKILPQRISSNKQFGIAFPLIGIFLFTPSLIITNQTFDSLKAQMLILQDFNSNQYNIPLNQIESFIPSIPNITVTTIPMDAIKARYYFHYKQYDKALALAEKAKRANPYLRYPEMLESQIYSEQGKKEKAWEAAEIAFKNLPRNQLHSSNFINLSLQLRKREAIKKSFPLLTFNNDENNWKNYLVAISQLYQPGEDPFVAQANEALKLFPDNQQIKNLHRLIILGEQRIKESIKYSKMGLDFFNIQNYAEAASAFEKAIDANPFEYAHYENAATSNYLVNNLDKAISQVDVVINDLNPLNGKSEYIKALILLKMGDPLGACPLLKISRDSGYDQADESFNQFCN